MNYNNFSKEDLIRILIEKDIKIKSLEDENINLKYLSSTDLMTGGMSRSAGLERLENDFNLVKLNGSSLSVCYIDIDGLKSVNDCFGHEEGDKLLTMTINVLRESIEKEDYIIRMGGDEFLVVFPKKKKAKAAEIFREITKILEEISESNSNYSSSFSYGFSDSRNKESILEIISVADNNMYNMKEGKKKDLCSKSRIIKGEVNQYK